MRVTGWHRVLAALACAVAVSPSALGSGPQAAAGARPGVQAPPAARDARAIGAERKLAAAVSEPRMVDTVRRLVAFGPRQYGTPSNHEAAAWLASAFREAGLEVTVREDSPRNWYEPVSWEIRAGDDGRRPVSPSRRPGPVRAPHRGRVRARSRSRRRRARCA